MVAALDHSQVATAVNGSFCRSYFGYSNVFFFVEQIIVWAMEACTSYTNTYIYGYFIMLLTLLVYSLFLR